MFIENYFYLFFCATFSHSIMVWNAFKTNFNLCIFTITAWNPFYHVHFFLTIIFLILIVVWTILLQCCLQICYGIITFLQLLIKSLEFMVHQFSFCHQHLNFMFLIHDFHINLCNDFELTFLSSLFFYLHHCLGLFNFFFNFEIFCWFSKPLFHATLSVSSIFCWFTSFSFSLTTS